MESLLGQNPSEHYFLAEPPSTLRPYRFPEEVTRENFIAFIARSFLVSRGDADKQGYWLDFARAHTGFHYTTAFSWLLDHGGWNALTPDEQSYFTDCLLRVKAHHHQSRSDIPSVVDIFLSDPASEFNDQLAEHTVPYEDEALRSRLNTLAAITSEQAFLRWLKSGAPLSELSQNS